MYKSIVTLVLIFVEIQLIRTNEISEFIQLEIPQNLTTKCHQQMVEYLLNLQFTENSWSLKMLDATSKLPTGLLSMNFGELGNFDQCIQIDQKQTNGEIYGKYCLGNLHLPITNAILLQSTLNPTWAICLPNQCYSNDTTIIVNNLLEKLIHSENITISFDELFCHTKDNVYRELTTGAIITISFLVILVVLVIISTIYDLFCRYNDQVPIHNISIAFSCYTNGRKVFRMVPPNSDQLPCMNGLKFISMMWVVSGHTFSVPISGAVVNVKNALEWADSWRSMFIVSGTLSVDTFFVITGSLMVYGFMKAKQKNIKFNLFMYYLHRYLRLTPSLAVVVLISSTLLTYLGSGPRWRLLDLYFQGNCENYWWSALLYVQNYVNVSEMCVGQTWYLDIDMQLYLISPIVFFTLWKRPNFGFLLIGVCIVISLGLSFYTAWTNDLTAILSNFYGNSQEFNNRYYLLTHTRASPWFIGVVLGYILFQIKSNRFQFQLSRIIVLLLWFLCFVVMILCVFGGFSTLRNQNYDKWGNSLHITFVRPAWSLCICWIIFGCVNNYGGPINWLLSLPIYQVLNRFTYSIYLTHVTILYMIVFGLKTPLYFNDFNMAYSFWGILWISTLLSVLIVFTVESPMIVIEKSIFGIHERRINTPNENIEAGIDNPAFNK